MPSHKHQGCGPGRDWNKFELDVVLGLICKDEHLNSSIADFAMMVNESINGGGNNTAYKKAITVKEVQDVLMYIETKKKGALDFVQRQPRPHVMTRTKRRMFERNLPFTGSKKEWVAGRRDEVMAARKSQEHRRRDGGRWRAHTNRGGAWFNKASSGAQSGSARPFLARNGMPGNPLLVHFSDPSVSYSWNNRPAGGGPTLYGPCKSSLSLTIMVGIVDISIP
jgi:hypothetical protein